MKSAISISFVLLIFASLAKDLMVFAAFKLNQEDLTKKYCINIDAPEIKCKGKCFLSQQIKAAYERASAPVPLQKMEEPSKVNYLSLDRLLPAIFHPSSIANVPFHKQCWKSRLYSNPPFHPPTAG